MRVYVWPPRRVLEASGQPFTGATALAAGGYDAWGRPSEHSCAVVDAALRCWGWNTYGQLGDGTTSASPTPVHVVDL